MRSGVPEKTGTVVSISHRLYEKMGGREIVIG